MSSNSLDLLRMLEPAVRPVGTPGVGRVASGKAPLEAQSFDSLLAAAQTAAPDAPAADVLPEHAPKSDALAPLSGLGAIESASLRELIAGRKSGT